MIDLENIDVNAITTAQRAAEKKVEHLTTEEWKFLRRRAKTDLMFLGRGILGYTKLSKNLHGHLSTWLKLTINEAKTRVCQLPKERFDFLGYSFRLDRGNNVLDAAIH